MGLEGAMVVASLHPDGQAAALLFDFAAAFPSLGHGWVSARLHAMRVAPRLCALIEVMYMDMVTTFAVGCHGACGVASGRDARSAGLCSLSRSTLPSGTSWSRRRSRTAVLSPSRTTALSSWRASRRRSRRWRVSSRTGGGAAVCAEQVLLPFWEGPKEAVRLAVDALPAFAGMHLSRSARYLGIQVGPHAAADQPGPGRG